MGKEGYGFVGVFFPSMMRQVFNFAVKSRRSFSKYGDFVLTISCPFRFTLLLRTWTSHERESSSKAVSKSTSTVSAVSPSFCFCDKW